MGSKAIVIQSDSNKADCFNDLSHVVKLAFFIYNKFSMKNIILIKFCNNIQLAHLYEHLFIKSINDLFYSNGLLKFLDYSLSGTTYNNGIIAVDCILYINDTKNLIAQIKLLQIDLGINNNLVDIALNQIIAEESFKIHVTNKDKLLNSLIELDKTPWENIEKLEIFNMKTARVKPDPIYLTKVPQKITRKLRISLILDDIHNNDILPLYSFLSQIIMFTLINKLTWHEGMYSSTEMSMNKNLRFDCYLDAHRMISKSINIDEVLQMSKSVLNDLNKTSINNRVIKSLTDLSFIDAICMQPDYERILLDTKILIGLRGWQQIATLSNMQKIYENISIEIKFGKLIKRI